MNGGSGGARAEAVVWGTQAGRVMDLGSPAGVLHIYEPFRFAAGTIADRRIDVLVPRDYDQTDRRHPVLYVNDGHTVFFPGGCDGGAWEMDRALAGLSARKAIPPVIVVAVYPVDRDSEYTHAAHGDPTRSGLERYTQAIAGEVKEFIDGNYRTDPRPASAMILGASHGGLAAFHMALRRPDCFGFAAAFSPSFWCGLDDAADFPYVRHSPGKTLSDSPLIAAVRDTLGNGQCRPKLFLQWGLVRTNDPHNQCIEHCATIRGREMAGLLQDQFGYRLNTELFVCEDPDGDHTEASWRRHLPRVLGLFAG